jgi:hypothetical protein
MPQRQTSSDSAQSLQNLAVFSQIVADWCSTVQVQSDGGGGPGERNARNDYKESKLSRLVTGEERKVAGDRMAFGNRAEGGRGVARSADLGLSTITVDRAAIAEPTP